MQWLRKHWWGTTILACYPAWGAHLIWKHSDTAELVSLLASLVIWGLIIWKCWQQRSTWRQRWDEVGEAVLFCGGFMAVGYYTWGASWPLWILGTLGYVFVWGIGKAIVREVRRKPEPEMPPLRESWVRMDATTKVTELEHGQIHVIGALTSDKGGDMAGMCAAQPDEYVMDQGGFIVSSPDPSVHPGAVPTCVLPEGHGGRHSWQSAMPCGHRGCTHKAVTRFKYRPPSSVGYIWEDVCAEHEEHWLEQAAISGIDMREVWREDLRGLVREQEA